MATVTEAVKESLLGKEAPASLSSESRLTFLKHANKEEDGELYMSEEDFINAIAPPEEDYVSDCPAVPCRCRRRTTIKCTCRLIQFTTDATFTNSTKSSASSMAFSSASQTGRSGPKSP